MSDRIPPDAVGRCPGAVGLVQGKEICGLVGKLPDPSVTLRFDERALTARGRTPHDAEPERDIPVPHVHKPRLEGEEEPSLEPTADPPVAGSPQKADRGRQQSTWLLKVGLEVLLISVGVFLALMGEQWRENAHTRELAEDSLRRFRAEIVANRTAVAAVKDYHDGLLKSLRVYLAADPKRGRSTPCR